MQRGLPRSQVRLAAVATGSLLSLKEGVKAFLGIGVSIKDIRVPLDEQQERQRARRCQRFWLMDTNVKSNFNVLKIWEIIIETGENTKGKLFPILVDDNLHYHIAKFM